MIEALIQAAEARGYRIRWHRGGPKAAWVPSQNTITVQIGMDDATTLCSLAHELGHAHYGDAPTGNGHLDQRQEQRADMYAARLLISPVEFEAAVIWHQDHLPAIADELEVTQHLLNTWLRNTQLAA
ncbi:ImmA/IrrE family metallo-endopeptidase [Corynebacterium accolens]|uniref:ImmA/IrrE family metallo-endopeptidase n=1 Tax=Corynebacterium accolens TaxID=38284 RepID=UPI00019C45D7|nr:ImmA/IrrE family metallo-endopeptidase [Corynebacterium accolens]EEI14188.1 hypothetical protein HMPREF0276_1767 [Corynebacterium accolens ATCC 49725]UQZ28431.1 hypothetical protein CACC_08725 [Corynebacterium accolens]